MQSPLIVGASVSGDYLTPSPGKRLALRHTTLDRIRVIARQGKPGREMVRSVSPMVLKDRSSIICVDTFFWDSLATTPAESLRALETLSNLSLERGIPLVLGEIPNVLESFQRSVVPLNRKIEEIGRTNSNCRVIPINAIVQKTFSQGYLEQNGRRFPIASLLPDGLHISEPASEYLADQIAKLFE